MFILGQKLVSLQQGYRAPYPSPPPLGGSGSGALQQCFTIKYTAKNFAFTQNFFGYYILYKGRRGWCLRRKKAKIDRGEKEAGGGRSGGGGERGILRILSRKLVYGLPPPIKTQ